MPAARGAVVVPLVWDEAGKTSGYWSYAGSPGIGGEVADWSKASMEVEIGAETGIDAFGWHYRARIYIYANRW